MTSEKSIKEEEIKQEDFNINESKGNKKAYISFSLHWLIVWKKIIKEKKFRS